MRATTRIFLIKTLDAKQFQSHKKLLDNRPRVAYP